jgi:5-methylcytosine-specific restriction endonuclease McrA
MKCTHMAVDQRENGPHIEEFCADCGGHLRFVPRSEVGLSQRSVASRKGVKPRVRAQVFERFGHACYLCGRGAAEGVMLQVDHILPVELAKRHGVYDEVVDSELNLAPVCEECNLGKGAEVFGAGAVRLMVKALHVWGKREAGGE